ncbi:MAG TPA: tetratricopeptide repeat protein [Chthonomonadaceae bacterium]|nr:tetratricopeptide repeat protein [Chthonomonadaceae bacterium]
MSSPVRPTRLRTGFALGLLALAVVAWAIVLARQFREAPVQKHIDAAIEYTNAGQARQAEREWREALRAAPNNADAWEQLGELYASAHDWPRAVEAFQRLQQLKPETPHVYERLAAASLRTGNEVAALKYSQEELRRDPDNITALAITGFLYGDMGDKEKQLQSLRRLVQVRPNEMDFLLMLGEALVNQQKYTEARPIADRILEQNPDSSFATMWRGLILLNTDHTPQGEAQAEADLLRALQLNPQNRLPRLYLGQLYRRQKKLDRAVAELEEAARLMPGRTAVFYELAGAYAQAGQSQKAAQAQARFKALEQERDRLGHLEELCAANPNDFDAHLQLGLTMLQRGDIRRASSHLTSALRLRPNDARVRTALQTLSAQTGMAGPDALLRNRTGEAAPAAPPQ